LIGTTAGSKDMVRPVPMARTIGTFDCHVASNRLVAMEHGCHVIANLERASAVPSARDD
jgi:hypothetical protein